MIRFGYIQYMLSVMMKVVCCRCRSIAPLDLSRLIFHFGFWIGVSFPLYLTYNSQPFMDNLIVAKKIAKSKPAVCRHISTSIYHLDFVLVLLAC